VTSRQRAALQKEKSAAADDRQKLKAAQQRYFFENAHRTGSDRRWRVSGGLVAVGAIAVVVASPLTVFMLFGLIFDGAFGYALSAITSGTALLLLATMPIDTRLVRFIVALCTCVAGGFALVYALIATLAYTDTRCVYSTFAVCHIVASAMSACVGVLALSCAAAAHALRRLPHSEGVPPLQLWAWAKVRMGRWPASVAILMAAPCVWAYAQPNATFVLSPRAALHRVWTIFRLANLGWGTAWAVAVVVAYSHGESDPVLPSLAVFAVVSLLVALLTTKTNRECIHEQLGRLGMHSEANAAALVAAVVGGLPAAQALEKGQRHFSGIAVSSLYFEDFTETDLASSTSLNARTSWKGLGQVDAFLSHSWHDPVEPKWTALTTWATGFEEKHDGRSPVIWFDKACIDQSSISESLACLPIFLAGCKKLLIIAGPSYVERLWCVMEIFTFIFMGGELSRVTFLSIGHGGDGAIGHGDEDHQMTHIMDAFGAFDANEAKCFIEHDRQRLLGVIESGIGSIDAFNALVRSIFIRTPQREISAKTVDRESRGAMERQHTVEVGHICFGMPTRRAPLVRSATQRLRLGPALEWSSKVGKAFRRTVVEGVD